MAMRKRSKANEKSIRVYRSGVKARSWNIVDPNASSRHMDDGVQIRANIAVDKTAMHQSQIVIDISTAGIVYLFESHFRIEKMSVGETALRLFQARRAASRLLDALDAISSGQCYSVNTLLDEIPLDKTLFEDEESVAKLRAVKTHEWDPECLRLLSCRICKARKAK